MRRVTRYEGILDLRAEEDYTEWEENVQHPPDFSRAQNILISRIHAITNASTGQTKKVALCVLTMQTYQNLYLLKEWLQQATNPQQQFMLFVHAKNKSGMQDAVVHAQLPIDTVVLGDVQTKWSSIGIAEASLYLFTNARRKGCKGAILMSGDAIPIKNPNIFHLDIINQNGPVRGGFRLLRNYPFAVGEQWMSLNEKGLDLMRHIDGASLYDLQFLETHFEAVKQHGLTKELKYEDNLRTAQIEDKYDGLAPDETLLQALLWSHLSAKEKLVAKTSVSWMQSDEHHALPINVDYLRKAPSIYLTARKVVTEDAYNQVRHMWSFLM